MDRATEESFVVSAEPVDRVLAMSGGRWARLEERIFSPLARLRRRGRLYLAIEGGAV